MISEYVKTNWLDHIVENPFTFEETKNEDGTIILEPKQGEILQQGTPVNARNLNHIEEGIWLNWRFLKELFDELTSLKLDVLTLKGTSINDMNNNMFFISFATLDDIKLKSGIHDPVNRRIYV